MLLGLCSGLIIQYWLFKSFLVEFLATRGENHPVLSGEHLFQWVSGNLGYWLVFRDVIFLVLSFVVSKQVIVNSWSSLEPVCTLVKDGVTVKAQSAFSIYKESINALLERCRNCTRKSCVVSFYLVGEDGLQSPMNHHFLSSLKDAVGLEKTQLSVSHVKLLYLVLLIQVFWVVCLF